MKLNCVIIGAENEEPFTGKGGKVYESVAFFLKERGDAVHELNQQMKFRFSKHAHEGGVLNGTLPKVAEATGSACVLTIQNVVGVRQNVVEVTGSLTLPAKK